MFASYTHFDQYCNDALSGTFSDYIAFNQQHIRQVRQQANVACDDQVITMNAPFEYRPSDYDGKKAVLLIHGFLASPYIMRSVAQVYFQQGFLVRSILLPGHGTVPGELKTVNLEHWQRTVEYGIESLKRDAQEVHLCGYSLGATLACIATQQHTIKTLVLLSPAFAITRSAWILPYSSRLPLEPMQWVCKLPEDDLATYRSIAAHGAWQVLRAIRLLTPSLHQIQLPCFIAASFEDSTVKIKPILQFLQHNTHPRSYLRLYCKLLHHFKDSRIQVVHSSVLAPNVLDISHIAVPVAPNDLYYGNHGAQKGTLPEKHVLGEKNKLNLRQPNFYRLSYNPDFEALQTRLIQFFDSNPFC